MLQHSAREAEIVSAVGDLASLPDVYLRVRQVIDDPDSGVADVTRVLASDPAISARILRLANSAAFGISGEVDTLSKAVTVLGLRQVHDLVLATSLADISSRFRYRDLHAYWRRSVLTALAVQAITRRCGLRGTESLMICGLLSDIGHLLLFQTAPEAAQHAATLSRLKNIPLHLAEREVIGADYAGIGAALLESWQLPEGIHAVVRHHVEPKWITRHRRAVALLHIASAIGRYEGALESAQPADLPVVPEALEELGLDFAALPGLLAEAHINLGTTLSLLFPNARAA